MTAWTVDLPPGAPEFSFEYTDATKDGWHARVKRFGSAQPLGTVEIFTSRLLVAEPNTDELQRAARILRALLLPAADDNAGPNNPAPDL